MRVQLDVWVLNRGGAPVDGISSNRLLLCQRIGECFGDTTSAIGDPVLTDSEMFAVDILEIIWIWPESCEVYATISSWINDLPIVIFVFRMYSCGSSTLLAAE